MINIPGCSERTNFNMRYTVNTQTGSIGGPRPLIALCGSKIKIVKL